MEFLYPHVSDYEMHNINFLQEGGVIVLPSVFHSLLAVWLLQLYIIFLYPILIVCHSASTFIILVLQENESLQNQVNLLKKDLQNKYDKCRCRMTDNQNWIEENDVKLLKLLTVSV
jgi:hypothetical protein